MPLRQKEYNKSQFDRFIHGNIMVYFKEYSFLKNVHEFIDGEIEYMNTESETMQIGKGLLLEVCHKRGFKNNIVRLIVDDIEYHNSFVEDFVFEMYGKERFENVFQYIEVLAMSSRFIKTSYMCALGLNSQNLLVLQDLRELNFERIHFSNSFSKIFKFNEEMLKENDRRSKL
jgi:hypothetical protein